MGLDEVIGYWTSRVVKQFSDLMTSIDSPRADPRDRGGVSGAFGSGLPG